MNHLSIRWLTATTLALSLAACGGGGGSSEVTGTVAAPVSSGSQFASGTITGFGSVIVEGVRYDDSSASVKVEDDASSPSSSTLSALKLGMQVELQGDDSGRASSVTVSSEVFGRITALTSGGFIVAGQTVRVSTDLSSPTVFEDVSGLTGLAVNDFVEVHGKRDTAGAIVASRIELKDGSSLAAVRVVGAIAGLDAAAKTFSLSGLTVAYGGTTRVLPSGAVLANGQRVAVWSDTAIVGNTLTAKSLVVKRHNLGSNDLARLGGLIRDLDFAARTFKVDGVDVDATAASFDKGTATDLANGRKVRVRGMFVDGRLKAAEVRFVKDQDDAQVELTGVVTDFAGIGSFKVRGVPVDASGQGIEFKNGSPQNLANGVLVKVEGKVEGSVVKPRELSFVTSDDARSRWLLGEVSGYAAASGTFKLMGLDARLTDSTTFRNGDTTAAVRADFGNGDRVQLRGAFSGGSFVVSEVVFRPGVQLVIDGVEGGAYEVDLAAGVFKLNGTVVRIGPTTVFEGSSVNLRNGAKVEVYGTIVAGELVASKVEVKLPDGTEAGRLKGMISDFVSVADFRVAGQKVDASAARFDPSTTNASMLANGRFVEITGPVTAGVVKATKVELK